MNDRHGHGYECTSKEDFQRERIADAMETLVCEVRETQNILLMIAQHLVGGMSPAEVEQTKVQAREMQASLGRSKRELAAAVKSQSKTT